MHEGLKVSFTGDVSLTGKLKKELNKNICFRNSNLNG
jgi:hypothetical protein|tara:strand:+ start:237 stop:347 length:111 start_codon:yes stop_codon:yes gene_type:complete